MIDSLITGRIYRFISCATNAYGDSDLSLEEIAGLGSMPSAPSDPTRNLDVYADESMLIEWGAVTNSDLPILGYVL